MRKRISVTPTLHEKTAHFHYRFPFYAELHAITDYENNTFQCHWHNELELTLILEGQMEYHLNEKCHLVSAGTGILVNNNALHMARAVDAHPCKYLVVIFDAALIDGQSAGTIKDQYITPLTENAVLEGLLIQPGDPGQEAFEGLMREIMALNQTRPDYHELLIKAALCKLWALLHRQYLAEMAHRHFSPPVSISYIKQMLAFIHENYQQPLTLRQIAQAGHVSESACCRIFKKTLRKTPFQYLHEYRIQKSLPLLVEGAQSITEIAQAVGFGGASYYAEIFKKYMRTTPRDYRQAGT